MGYRGTRAQLEARLAALPNELEAMHEQLAEASRKVEGVRRQEWGRLGVWWFRRTLRRALRDVDASTRHDGTDEGIARAVRQHEQALTQGRDVLRWLDESLGPRESDEIPESPSQAGMAARAVLALLGAMGRDAWAVLKPVLLVLGVIALVLGALGGGGGDGPPEGFFNEGTGNDRGQRPMTPEERHAADVEIGVIVLSVLGLLAACGAGLWWWLA